MPKHHMQNAGAAAARNWTTEYWPKGGHCTTAWPILMNANYRRLYNRQAGFAIQFRTAAVPRPILSGDRPIFGGFMTGASRGMELQPGTICSQSGIYQATHVAHRPPHNVVVRKGDRFPQCNECGDAVRFHFVASHDEIQETSTSRLKALRTRGAGRG